MSSPPDTPRDAFDVGGRGLQPQGLRRANERAVLTVVAFHPGLSNAEIARHSGLAPQTVSAILLDLETSGLIQRGSLLRGRRGQPATPIFLHPEGAYSVGVDIGPHRAELLLINLHAEVRARQRLDYRLPEPASLVPAIAGAIEAMTESVPDWHRERLGDLGLALPTQLGKSLDLAPALRDATGLDVHVEDSGSAAAWAHIIDFEPPRPARFIHLFIGRSISAGLMSEGLPWQGPSGSAANLGAVLVPDASGRSVPADQLASLEALARAARIADGTSPEEWDFVRLGRVLERWLESASITLANVIYNTAAVVGAPLVVIDGPLPPDILERLRAGTDKALGALPLDTWTRPRLVAGRLGAEAIAMGAAELPLYRRYFSRSLADIAG